MVVNWLSVGCQLVVMWLQNGFSAKFFRIKVRNFFVFEYEVFSYKSTKFFHPIILQLKNNKKIY